MREFSEALRLKRLQRILLDADSVECESHFILGRIPSFSLLCEGTDVRDRLSFFFGPVLSLRDPRGGNVSSHQFYRDSVSAAAAFILKTIGAVCKKETCVCV